MSKERMDYLKAYFDNQKVKVSIPPFESMTSKGKVIYRFTGKRNGYEFNEGVAFVDKADVHLFENSHYIIDKGENK